jgi:hypothetical protein
MVPRSTSRHGGDEQDNAGHINAEVFPLVKREGMVLSLPKTTSQDDSRRLIFQGSIISVLIGTTLLFCNFWWNQTLLDDGSRNHKNPSLIQAQSSRVVVPTLPQLSCPATLTETTQNPHQDLHRNDGQYILHNLSDYEEHFHNLQFDGWDATYDEYKEAMRKWKLDLIQSLFGDQGYMERTGDHSDTTTDVWVYESASGIGLNLRLTVEIWNEATTTTTNTGSQQQEPLNVAVFGNDYVEESVHVAQYLWKTVPPPGGQYGKMCQGDSTQIHQWVPPNTFDVVFTGFVTPLHDPLHLGLSDYELDRYYAALCSSTDPADVAQAQLLQDRQNDWFANWTSEMLRITRPGGVVAVEMISYPTCDDLDEWGGVASDWWTDSRTALRYHWPVDSATIVVQPELMLPGNRYHVRMHKKKF